MKKSIYTNIAIVIKKILRINDFSLFKKNIHKKIGKLIYHQKYDAGLLMETLRNLGVRSGMTICIHSSMKEFYNYQGTPEDIILGLMQIVGQEGTIMMPAFPDLRGSDIESFVFDKERDSTKAGLLAETFRKMPGVKRSINVQHSVCAWGKHAEWLIKDHHNCRNCWDENSPWYRLTVLNGLVICLGMPRWFIGTFDHCVEGLLYKEHPYWAQFFTKEIVCHYYDDKGTIQTYSTLYGDIDRRSRENRLQKYFSASEYKQMKLSNLNIGIYESHNCLDKMLRLGRKGITMYYVPSPRRFKF